MQLGVQKVFLLCFVVSACVSVLLFVTVSRGVLENLTSRFARAPIEENSTQFSICHPSETDGTDEGLLSMPSRNGSDLRKILLWSPLFDGWGLFQPGAKTFKEFRCPENRCEITHDRGHLEECHAVVFHIRTLTVYDLPRFRDHAQKWIFFSLESPPYSYFSGFNFMFGMFNWTMTYRNDSDIVLRYGRVSMGAGRSRKEIKRADELGRIWRAKSKIAVWMVSHCHTSSNREAYVTQLQKYMDVDIMGTCGLAVCPYNKTRLCLKTFSEKYKFFLAFENSICDGYVTEKFFRVLELDIVPVVLGGADYEKIAPPKSYINALNYSPRALALYLNVLASNSSRYFEYFKWKDKGYDVQDDVSPCELCSKLHSRAFRESSHYGDVGDWWSGKSHCRTWKDALDSHSDLIRHKNVYRVHRKS